MSNLLREVLVNGKWPLQLLEHRAARPQWPYWEAHRLALAYELIKPGMTVWEIGAEEGDYPALYGTWGANVVAVEPNPFVWPQIKTHWEANSLAMLYEDEPVFRTPTITPIVGLASDENVKAEPDYPNGWRDGWPEVAYGEIFPEHGFRNIWEHSTVSPQIIMDDVAADNENMIPDVICMDIEGGEVHALRGMTWTLKMFRPHVIVSIHPEFLKTLYGQHRNDVMSLASELDYEPILICIDHEEHVWLRPK